MLNLPNLLRAAFPTVDLTSSSWRRLAHEFYEANPDQARKLHAALCVEVARGSADMRDAAARAVEHPGQTRLDDMSDEQLASISHEEACEARWPESPGGPFDEGTAARRFEDGDLQGARDAARGGAR